jgi:hypothetical protein
VVTNILASTLHTGAGDLISPTANRIWDLGFDSHGSTSTSSCHPWRPQAPLQAPHLLSPTSSSPSSLSYFTLHTSTKESIHWHICEKELDYTRCALSGLSRGLRGLLQESLEATIVSTGAMFPNARRHRCLMETAYFVVRVAVGLGSLRFALKFRGDEIK